MKKHLWKLLIAAFAVTSAFTSHALAYSPNDAINYAEQYANSYNLLDSSGSGFNNYHPNGGILPLENKSLTKGPISLNLSKILLKRVPANIEASFINTGTK